MRSLSVGVALAAVLAVAQASPASAAAQVERSAFHGVVADAVWDTRSAGTSTSTEITVARNEQGKHLSLYQFTAMVDGDGAFTGATLITADVRTGFVLSLNGSLSGASVSGNGVPATTCSYDGAGALHGCATSTVDLDAVWVGHGAGSSAESTSHFHSDNFTSTYHERGFFREATATGMVDGLSLTDGSLLDAHLSKDTYGSVEVCVGSSC